MTVRAIACMFIFILNCLWLFSSCEQPVINVREEILPGESPQVIARGLVPGREYALRTKMTDNQGRLWRSTAVFQADQCGQIDLSRAVPVDSSYRMPDPLGMISILTPQEPVEQGNQRSGDVPYNQLTFALRLDEATIASAKCKQLVTPLPVEGTRLGGELVAELFSEDPGKKPAVMFIGGSGGGMSWARRSAALLSRQGLTTMALAYFNAESLPSHLLEIPLEYVELALDSLKARPETNPDRIALVGYSKGAELALLMASRRPDVRAVAAFAPGSAVFQGFRPPDYPVRSSWSYRGNELPFVPNAYDKQFFRTFDGMYLWYRTLSQHESVAYAAIPVENINGNILLVSGIDDRIWPATYMGEQIVARLRLNGWKHDVRHLAFPEAGHGIAAPPGEPLVSISEKLGGTPEGNGRARTLGWTALIEFLEQFREGL